MKHPKINPVQESCAVVKVYVNFLIFHYKEVSRPPPNYRVFLVMTVVWRGSSRGPTKNELSIMVVERETLDFHVDRSSV